MTTMHDLYGDYSQHQACDRCGQCVKCGDCTCKDDELTNLVERLRAELEDYRWLCTVPLIVDTVADPDNLVQVWVGTDPSKCYRGKTVEEAIRSARNAESASDPRPDAKT